MASYSLRGINVLNDVQVVNDRLTAVIGDQPIFEIPTKHITNCTVINNDVILEFNDEEQTAKEDGLLEMRFYVHQGGEEDQLAENLGEKIRQHVQLDEATDNLFCILPDLPFAIPRGKYTTDVFAKSFKLHGASYNYQINYKNITKAFLLPMPDRQNVVFVIGLDKPLRQGQTSYKYIALQFKTDQTIELDLKGREEALKAIDPTLELHIEGNYYEVFTRIFRAFSGVNVIIPGDFRTTKDESALKCSIGAKQGHLFLLSKSLIFVLKSIIHIRYEDIVEAIFHRVTQTHSMRGFDLEVIPKSGAPLMFAGIDKTEIDVLKNFLSAAKVQVSIAKEETNLGEDDYEEEEEGEAGDSDDDEEEDDDYEREDSFVDKEDEEEESEDEDFDPEKHAKKKKRKSKGGDEDDD
jgi:structure-specific recognition protein 1